MLFLSFFLPYLGVGFQSGAIYNGARASEFWNVGCLFKSLGAISGFGYW